MKHRISIPLLLVFSFFPFSFSSATNLVDTLQQRLDIYTQEKPVNNLYVHLDRNNYTPEDTIWFKAYMLSAIENEVLYTRITDSKKNIVLEKQFLMYDIRAHGDISLPDTLSEGKYFFYAYTDRMINFNPDDVFVQPITVSKNIMNRLEIEAFVTDPNKLRRGEKVEIVTKIKGAPGKIVKGTFSLLTAGKVFKTGRLSTNSLGEAYVRFTYPKIANNEMVRCEVKFTKDKEYAEIFLNLRHKGNSVKIKVSPEGGHLLEGIVNNTVFEALDDNNSPVSTLLVLKDEKKVIDTIKTNNDGIGEIRFKPQKNAHYIIEINENDTTKFIDFPSKIETNGYGLRIEEGKGRHTAIISNCGNEDSATLVLRSFDKILWSNQINVRSGDSTSIDLPVQDLPKGVLNLTIFDSAGIPVTERLFMNKLADEYQVQINTRKTVNAGQTKVAVNLNITDRQGVPAATNLSVSVVEKSTLNVTDYRTILQSYYFKNLSYPNKLSYNERESGFDAFLVTKSWGGYGWRRITSYSSTGSIKLLANTGGLFGFAKANKGWIPALKELIIESKSVVNSNSPILKKGSYKGTGSSLGKINDYLKNIPSTAIYLTEIIPLDSNGYFSIHPHQLVVNRNEKKYLMLGDDFYSMYDIGIKSYFKEFDAKVKAGESLVFSQPFNAYTKYEMPTLKTFNKAIQLKEVTVETNITDFGNENIGIGKSDDYVCSHNVLNCYNHQTGETPVVGMVYYYRNPTKLIVYNGFGKPLSPAPIGILAGESVPPPSSLPIMNISLPNEFYLPNSSDTTFLKVDTRPTVFWTPNLNTDTTGKASFEFYTSDRKGDFIIVVQGIEINTLRPVYYTYNLKL